MKLLRAGRDQFQVEMSHGEKLRLTHLLKLYPLVPSSHHRLSQGRNLPHPEENQQWLEEALNLQRRETRQQVESLLNEPERFVKCAGGWQAGFTRGEIECLLQVLNDVRVGSWIALGSPEPQEEAGRRLTAQSAPHIVTLEMAGYFQSWFLEAVSGELQPDDGPRILPVLGPAMVFPDPERAEAEGLLAIGGDLTVERLLAAYRQGIFPWTANPITWWSPDPRGILELDDFHVPESLARILRKRTFETTLDQAFPRVMEACAAPGPRRRSTWITPEFIAAYTQLHQQGHAHSVECWQNSELVGGIYGVTLGGLFAGESMFHRVDNASKVALHRLVEHLRARGFALFDIQMVTASTAPLGAKAISRRDYLERLAKAVTQDCRF